MWFKKKSKALLPQTKLLLIWQLLPQQKKKTKETHIKAAAKNLREQMIDFYLVFQHQQHSKQQ